MNTDLGRTGQPGGRLEAAHAKVNLGLAVLARRGDGFHEIETAMVNIRLADDVEVTVTAAATDQVALSVVLAPDLPPVDLALGEDNLAHSAASGYLRARREADGNAVPMHVGLSLVKRVPVAAGLGGGSADAGAVLRALALLLPSGVDVLKLAAMLGSDVPFMLGPAGAALAKGRGERVTAVQLPRLNLVLANPGFAVSAADAYANLVGFTPRLRLERSLERLAAGEEPGWSNALQQGVLKLRPTLRGVLASMRGTGLRGVIMSGSGPTCLGVARDDGHAEEAAAALRTAEPGFWVKTTTTW